VDQIKAMRAFARAADEGSLAGAARALDLSPPVVTRLISDLEADLGVRLLHRTTRRITLTETGEAYLIRARRILEDLDEAQAMARCATDGVEGVIRVAAPPAFAAHQLAPHLPRFLERHPGASVEVTVLDHVHGVIPEFDVSVIVTGAVELSGDFVARPLAKSELVVCATPEFFRSRGKPSHPRDLESLDSVLPPVPGTRREFPFHRRTAGPAEAVFVRPRSPRLASMHLDTVYAAVCSGIGVGALPSFLAVPAIRSGRLERALPGWYLLAHAIHAGLPTRKFMPARTRAFIDFLVQAFGGDAADDPWLRALDGSQAGPAPRVKGRLGFGLARTPS
jgi:DNA-binding transcriptional LysR family regulator